MKMKAKRRVYYLYPVELVWKAIGLGSEDQQMDPLSEEEYESKEPAPNVVFTRALEVETNKVFAFQMKARLFYSTMRIEMESKGSCETKVVVSQTVEPRKGGLLFCLLTMNVRREVRSFTDNIHQKLEKEFSPQA